ncbi:alpha-L-fucosidase [Flaviaesturariibacter flavus]|uniref:Alpha-L-fucosidase n=1 Tax=Flaviaesturariibacter flavus TaxID=2502780 RepID=A0A4R1BQK1_9BACT|nr:alpha-L-fucosidase [Flaviaesturariibacter flavus]TCJ19567.1 alpha-L-fucosidase [Flaviaesturariibacter flavus]
MAKQDLLFDSLTGKWEQGAFLGNGLLGVMVYRESPNALRFDLGRTDVIDHREGINPSIGRARLPIGRFLLETSAPITGVRLRLDLWNAELSGTLTTAKGTIRLRALVAATRDLILFGTETSGAETVRWQWKPEPAVSPFLTLGRDSAGKYPPNPPAQSGQSEGASYHLQPLLAGGGHTTAWRSISAGNWQWKAVALTNSREFKGFGDHGQSNALAQNTTGGTDASVSKALIELRSLQPAAIRSIIDAHRAHWHRFYARSFISIPDKRLESFWWIQQYKMGAATRPGALPIDLMGPWYRITPWPKYWWNLNIQLTYYPFFSSNHVALVQPLLDMVTGNIDNLSRNAPAPYQHNSAALARSGPYDMVSPVRVTKGNDSTGSSASMELGNLTWLLHVCYQAYEHTMDHRIQASLYPVLTRAVNYYRNIVEKGPDGRYHLPYTYSPEYPKGITRDANYDLSVLRWGLRTLLDANRTLGYRDTLAGAWKDLLDNLTDYPKDQYGFRIGRDAAFTLSHRHYSHLLMVYPIHDISWDRPGDRDLIRRSLEQWKRNDESWRGYSYTGSGSIHALMGEGDSTWKLLNEMMKGRFAIQPNTMYLEAGPVIETPLSAVTTLNEMLLQSHNGIIRIFPALPAAWSDVSFDKLLARGAFEVSAVRQGGVTRFVRIRSLAGGPCLLRTGFAGPVKMIGPGTVKLQPRADGLLSVSLKKGQEVILYSGQRPASLLARGVNGDDRNNYWGVHPMK